ncbi:hypothetical protein SEUCBS140593_007714 [Sporothrix eucalyptigena]|uniref:2EXR domain-containing protein n=1 Tax=Sporothrix eucalyptigena TaxID=1812306 RepID=A0ABP0CFH1_9PEZI
MADFDFSTEPAPDETINMEHQSSDGDDSGERDEIPFEDFGEEDERDSDEDEDSEEEEDYDDDDEIEAAFGRTTNLLGGGDSDDDSIQFHSDGRMVSSELGDSGIERMLSREAGEGSDDDDEEDWETTSSNRYGGEDDFDSENDDTDYENGAYDSDDSWNNSVAESPGGGINVIDNMDKIKARLSFYHTKEGLLDAPQTFPQFPKLPPELRMRIWETFCSELRRKNRVIQVMMQNDGRLTPAVTMDQQTEPTRRFMRICRETRAMGLRALPDTLHIGVSKHDEGEIRFNAETDVIHFLEEHPFGLKTIDPTGGEANENVENAEGNDNPAAIARRVHRRSKKKKGDEDIPQPYTSVRNLAINDMERRLREPGAYQDYFQGHTVIELIAQDDASHRRPSELRDEGYLKSIEYLFPNLENLYVVEHGAVRYLDRWAANLRSYQRYHVRGYEVDDIELHREPIEYLYCWHQPPKTRHRSSLPGVEGASEKQTNSEAETTEKKDGEENKTEETAEDKLRKAELNQEQPKDFNDECVINHFAKLRQRGIRFSRMLFFDEEDGMGDYYTLQAICRPDGRWPNDADGERRQDQQPSRDIGPPSDIEGFMEEYDEDDSMIDDEEEEEGDDDEESSEDDDDDEDDLHVVGHSDEPSAPPLEAMFSSPEPEPEADAETSKASRSKKRRVVDSDDEDDDEQEGDATKAGAERLRSPAKRQRRTAVLSSDEDDDDAGVGSSKPAAKATSKSKSKKTVESESSHTEPGDEDDEEEDEWEDEQPEKPLTLMQKLQMGRKTNPVSDDENSSNDDDEEAEEYAGDYGEGDDDEDEEDDE